MDLLQTRVEVARARDRAASLLASLQAELSNPLSQGGGGGGGSRRDLFKHVTGQSGLEAAASQARRMVDAYDRLLAEMDRVEAGSAGVHATREPAEVVTVPGIGAATGKLPFRRATVSGIAG